MQKYEKGETLPSETVQQKIADYGRVTVRWLLTGEDEAGAGGPLGLEEHVPEAYIPARPVEVQEFLLGEVLRVLEDYLARGRRAYDLRRRARLLADLYNHCARELESPSLLLAEKYDALIP